MRLMRSLPPRLLLPVGVLAFASALGGCAPPIPESAGPQPLPQYCLGNNAAITSALAGGGVGVLTGALSHNAWAGLGAGVLAGGLTYATLSSNCQQVAVHNALVQAREAAEAERLRQEQIAQERAAEEARREAQEAERRAETERVAELRAKEQAAEAQADAARERAARQQAEAQLAAQQSAWVDPQTRSPAKIEPLNSYTDPAGEQCMTYQKITYVNGVPQVAGTSSTCQGSAGG